MLFNHLLKRKISRKEAEKMRTLERIEAEIEESERKLAIVSRKLFEMSKNGGYRDYDRFNIFAYQVDQYANTIKLLK